MRLTKRNRNKNRLDITPLIDVVFLLLIFFMLTFSLPEQGINVNLPEKGVEILRPQEPLTLKIHNDGSLTLNNNKIGYDTLVSKLQNKMIERKTKALTVDVHRYVEYDVFIRVLDLAKKAGTENFSIMH